MKDWRSIAKASGLELSGQDIERIAVPLEALEDSFRPLVNSLKAEHEPSTAFSALEEAE